MAATPKTAKSKAPSATKSQKLKAPITTENISRGVLFSLLAIPVGIVLWVVLWKFGFIASLVSFAIAWLAIYLYAFGAKAPVSRKAAPYALGVIALGVLLSFVAGMASDAVEFFVQDTSMSQLDAMLSADYWAFLADNLFNNPELWSSYITDILIAVAFAALGCFSIVRSLFVTDQADVPAEAK